MFSHYSKRLGPLWDENRLVFQDAGHQSDSSASAETPEGKVEKGAGVDLSKLQMEVNAQKNKAEALAKSNPELVLKNAKSYLKNEWGKDVVALAAKTNPESAFKIAKDSNEQKSEWVKTIVKAAAENIDSKKFFALVLRPDYIETDWIGDAFIIMARRDPEGVRGYRDFLNSDRCGKWGRVALNVADDIIRTRRVAKAQVAAKVEAEAKVQAKAQEETREKAKEGEETQAKAPKEKPKLPPEPLSKEKQAEADEFADSLAAQGVEKRAELGELLNKQNEDLAHLVDTSWPKKKFDYHARFWGNRDYSWSGWSKKAFRDYVKAYDAAQGDKADNQKVKDAYTALEESTKAYPKLVETITKEIDKRYKVRAENLVRDYDLPYGVTVANVWTIKKSEYLSDDVNPALEEQQKKLPEKFRNPVYEKSFSEEHLGVPHFSDAIPDFAKDPEDLNGLFNKFFKTPLPTRKFDTWDQVVEALDESKGRQWLSKAVEFVGGPTLRMQAELKKTLGLPEGEDGTRAKEMVNDAILLKNMFEVEYLANKLRGEYKTDLNNALIRLDGEYGNLNPNEKEEIILAKVFGKVGPA